MDSKYEILFEPIEIGPKTLPNRFYQVPHCIGAGTDFPGMQAALRGVKAEGGWGAVCTEYVSIAPEDELTPFVLGTIWDDDDVENLRPMCEEVHRHGALAGIELGYGGPHSPNRASRLVARAPSQAAAEALSGYVTYTSEATLDDIDEMQQLWVDAALRSREAGFDIIYVYGGHAQGPNQFLSPFFNKRTDEYGGSFENRARFWLETLARVRQAVGDDCAIAARIALDDLIGSAGATLADTLRLIELADADVDLWDVMLGGQSWGEDLGTPRFFPENHQGEWQREVRPHTQNPIVGVGRFNSPDTMVEVIESGQLDVIGSARASIADPFLPRKIREGRLDDIRECTGNNACVARWDSFSPIVCTQNPTVGEEYRRGWHPESFSRAENADNDVLVLGAGPAGLECAMVLAKRQMRRVHLVDGASEVGGCMRWIGQLPRLAQWRRLVNFRQIQLDKQKNVEVILGKNLDVEAVLDYGAELVVIATGAEWTSDGTNWVTSTPIPGVDTDAPHCVTPDQLILEDKDPPGERMVVLDCDGYVAGFGVAELLTQRGCRVTYVTPFPHPAVYTTNTGEYPDIARACNELGIDVRTEQMVSKVASGSVEAHSLYSDGLERRFPGLSGDARRPVAEFDEIEADGIVVLGGRRSVDGIYRSMLDRRSAWADAGIDGVYRIGECVAPRQLAEIVFDGHRLGREIDSPNPAVHKPYLRERQLWTSRKRTLRA